MVLVLVLVLIFPLLLVFSCLQCTEWGWGASGEGEGRKKRRWGLNQGKEGRVWVSEWGHSVLKEGSPVPGHMYLVPAMSWVPRSHAGTRAGLAFC